VGGKMYWTECCDNPRIKRANLDGTGVETVLVATAGQLALDVAGGKMYWSHFDPATQTSNILRANLSGTGVEAVVTNIEKFRAFTLDLVSPDPVVNCGNESSDFGTDCSMAELYNGGHIFISPLFMNFPFAVPLTDQFNTDLTQVKVTPLVGPPGPGPGPGLRVEPPPGTWAIDGNGSVLPAHSKTLQEFRMLVSTFGTPLTIDKVIYNFETFTTYPNAAFPNPSCDEFFGGSGGFADGSLRVAGWFPGVFPNPTLGGVDFSAPQERVDFRNGNGEIVSPSMGQIDFTGELDGMIAAELVGPAFTLTDCGTTVLRSAELTAFEIRFGGTSVAPPPPPPENNPPEAQCRDNVIVEAGPGCEADAEVDFGSFDPDVGDSITLTQDPAGPYAFGNTPVTLTVEDNQGAADSCLGVVHVVDTTPPQVECNAPATISPRDAPVSFTATASDNCLDSVIITGHECPFITTPLGTRVFRDCVVSIDGATITIEDPAGVGGTVSWTVEVADQDGNVTTETCSVDVVRPDPPF
jgi:hypothetical protein